MNRNLLFVWMIMGFFATALKGQDCFETSDVLVLATQESIDNFATDYPDCITINGSITIEEESPGEIVDLSGLSQIQQIRGWLEIQNNSLLLNLTGLENLVDLGCLKVINNQSLNSLSGVESITELPSSNFNAVIEWGLFIEDNPSLTNLNGLANLVSVDRTFRISNNNTLTDLIGLSSLTNVGEKFEVLNCPGLSSLTGMTALSNNSFQDIKIQGNPGLTNLNGLEMIQTAERIDINENLGLNSFTGLHNLSIVEELYVADCPLIVDFTSLSSLSSITNSFGVIRNNGLLSLTGLEEKMDVLDGSILIQENPSLTSIEPLISITEVHRLKIFSNDLLANLNGLNNLESVSDATFLGNGSLVDLEGLEGLIEITHGFTLTGLESLESLSGLSSLKKIGRDGLLVQQNTSLIDFSGLDNLDSLGGSIGIYNNPSLASLDGLENLEAIMYVPVPFLEKGLDFSNNPMLADLSAISNLDLGLTSEIRLYDNDSLSHCGVESICSYLLAGGQADIYNNAPGCNSIPETIESCFDGTPHDNLVGSLIADANSNCADDAEPRIADWLVTFQNDSLDWITNADENGNYWLPAYEGDWTLDVLSPSVFWTSCFGDTIVSVSGTGDTIVTDFYMQPEGECSFIEWDLTIDQLRICDSSTIVINYCNYGALPSEDLLFIVGLDSFLTFQNASIPYTVDGDGNYIFAVDTLDLFECGEFEFTAFADCDSLSIWDIQCIDVELFSEELCSPDSLWDGSVIKATGYCENDSIYFELENIGTGNMIAPEEFRVEIVIDDIILFFNVNEYQLDAAELELLSYPVGNSQGMQIAVDQRPGFPGDPQATAIVPNCNDIENNELLFLLPLGDNGDPFTETFCEPAVNSFDPNDKSAIPVGLRSSHEIRKDWRLNYTIRFQNTGNAVANKVVILDQLSEYLDETSLSVGTASHPFTWELNQARELVFTFENILLPDSTANEPESHGYVRFSILPKQDILPYTVIENDAAIYFDSNEPILTNTVDHRILKPVVVSSAQELHCAGTLFNNMPIWNDTTVQLLTSFTAYDSIHFVHLEVVSSATTELDLDLPIGTLFEGILIEGDTTFSIPYTDTNGCDSIVIYTISGIVNTDDPDEILTTIEVFPNPTSDVIKVLYNKNGKAQNWSLINSIGQKVWQTSLDSNEEFKAMNVSSFPRGVYCLRVEMEGGGAVWKVVLE